MLHKISLKSANILYRKILPKESNILEIYIYGFTLFYSLIFTALTIIFLSILYGNFMYGLCFIIFFVPLRLNLGGYHSNTFFGCYTFTITLFTITFLLSTTCNKEFVQNITLIIFSLVSILLFYSKPSINDTHIITNKTIIYSKKNANLLQLINSIVLIILYFGMKLYRLSFCITITTSFVLLLNYLPALKTQRKNHVKRKLEISTYNK